MGCLRFSKSVRSTASLTGKTAVVTGCNTGIGKETVKDFVRRGCRVVMACRDVTKAEDAAREIRAETAGVADVGVIVVARLDLASFASVRQCAAHLVQTESSINLLVNNAGVMVCPKGLTEDGYERQFATNHLGHFLFTLLLLPRILKSAPARIVILSSTAHVAGNINFDDLNSEKSYSELGAYAQSKLANILFAKELARLLQERGHSDVTTYAVHPGAVATDLQRHADETYFRGLTWMYKNVFGAFVKSPEQGSRTSIYCAVAEKPGKETGLYYADCSVARPSSRARDPATAQRLWQESVRMCALQDYDAFTTDDRPPTVHAQQITVQPKN